MKYSEATDQYESEFLEKILDTDYRYGVYYEIDKEKYDEIVKKHNFLSRFSGNIVAIDDSYCVRDDGQIWLQTLFVIPLNYESDEQYDAFIFDTIDFETEMGVEKAHNSFLRELLGCIKGINIEQTNILKDEEISMAQKHLANYSILNELFNETLLKKQITED